MTALFSFVMLANAALIFWVELLFARKLLPTLGGAPAVWNTCLMFYQAMILAGYAYALLLTRLPLGRQVAIHGAILAAAVICLPWFLFVWPDPGEQAPVQWLLVLLTLSLGFPLFVLAAAAPLVQRWFSLSNHRDRRDPYFLYAASNLGSFLALTAYPLFLEPTFTLGQQETFWKASYVAVAVFLVMCGVWVHRRGGAGAVRRDHLQRGVPVTGGPSSQAPDESTDPVQARPAVGRRLRWVGLAFLPSSLLLGVTTHITSEIAPVPLLWVVPLALYLLTFVIAFGPGRRWTWIGGPSPEGLRRGHTTRSTWIAVGLAGLLLTGIVALRGMGVVLPDVMWLLVLADLAVLTAAGLVCHGRLALDRPHPRHLAEFYLWLAVGGALGGVFNALVAPLVFTDPLEYPLMLAAFAYLVASGSRASGRNVRVGDVLFGALPGVTAFLLVHASPLWEVGPGILLIIPGLLCLALAGRPARFGLGIAGLVLVGFNHPAVSGDVVLKERTFYGIHRIYQDGDFVWLAHGTTVHGGQRMDRPDIPLTYYHPAGPAGSLFAAFNAQADAAAEPPRDRSVASVGLGTGSLITYAAEGQRWTHYELDPTVIRIAEDSRYFTYLREASVPYRHVLGDARLSLARATGVYDLIVIDAFSSDAIPVHLLTREAVELYLDRLAQEGWIAFHVSNRYADFSDVLANVAFELGLTALEARDELGSADGERYPSHWIVLARPSAEMPDEGWTPLPPTGARSWTDSHSSLFQVLRLRPAL